MRQHCLCQESNNTQLFSVYVLAPRKVTMVLLCELHPVEFIKCSHYFLKTHCICCILPFQRPGQSVGGVESAII